MAVHSIYTIVIQWKTTQDAKIRAVQGAHHPVNGQRWGMCRWGMSHEKWAVQSNAMIPPGNLLHSYRKLPW